MPSIETYQLLLAAVASAEDKKAEDIRILALDPTESGLSDYFLICNGTNDRQNVAITDEIELRLKHDFGIYPNSVEGRREGEWVLMDYVDFIVHVFSPEKREYYGLERLRKSATTISPADLNGELKQKIAEARSRSAKKTAEKSSAKKAAPVAKESLEKMGLAGKKTTPAKRKASAKKSVSSRTATKPAGPKAARMSRTAKRPRAPKPTSLPAAKRKKD